VSDDPRAWGGDWLVRLRVWVERAGRALLGPGRAELLAGIDRCHSISAAARAMSMSYRRAWLLVQDINEASGEPLVVAATGGAHGGGARLTPRGRRALDVFEQLQGQLLQAAGGLLPRLIMQPPDAPAVHVAAAVSLEEVLGQLLAEYALQQPSVRVRAIFGASDELADHLLAGAPADLFLVADPLQLGRLEAVGLVRPGARAVLACNTLAVIGPAGETPAVRRPPDLANAGAWRLVLADPACPLGGYTRAYLESLGLSRSLLSQAIVVDNSRAVVAAVRAGTARVGLAYGSDAAHADGCRLLFRVRRPPLPIRYEAAIVCRGNPPHQASDLLEFLTSAPAARRFHRCGFLPAD
jgi:molybdenum ABC transporter molybdate-binding protein